VLPEDWKEPAKERRSLWAQRDLYKLPAKKLGRYRQTNYEELSQLDCPEDWCDAGTFEHLLVINCASDD
jgi:hypothetical protein